MIRAWILFSSLTLGVLFKAWTDYGTRQIGFPLSDKTLNTQSWTYYTMEHVIAIGVALCLLIKDSTHITLLKLFLFIMILDLIHYELFFRDEGPGWNLIKCALFGIPLIYLETKRNWTHLRKYINQE